MLINWLERHGRLTDVALVLLVFGTIVVGSGSDHRSGVGIGIALLLALPLLGRHRFPLTTLAITTALTAVVIAGWSFYNPSGQPRNLNTATAAR